MPERLGCLKEFLPGDELAHDLEVLIGDGVACSNDLGKVAFAPPGKSAGGDGLF